MITGIISALAGRFGYDMEVAFVEYISATHPAITPHEFAHTKRGATCVNAHYRNPNGTQNSPDFALIHNGRIYEIELKSSATSTTPTWNSGLPVADRIYIVNIPKVYRDVMLVFGRDIITGDEIDILSQIKTSAVLVAASTAMNELLKGTNWSFYLRHMFVQKQLVVADVTSSAVVAEFARAPGPAETTDTTRAQLGQYMTPITLADELLSLIPSGEYTHALEPSAGTGNLLRVIASVAPTANVVACELDSAMCTALASANTSATVIVGDFLLQRLPRETFDLIVANPPYVELRELPPILRAEYKKLDPEIARGRANLYSLFVASCVRRLAIGGIGAFIIPASYISSPRLCAFVKRYCDTIHCVRHKFAGVSQDVVLLVLRRVLLPTTVPVDTRRRLLVDCTIRTGSFVWNQHKSILTDTPGTLLVYSANIRDVLSTNVKLVRVNSPDKHQYVGVTDLVPMYPPFIATTRICGSSGCGFRAVLVDVPAFVENHVNTITCDDHTRLPAIVAVLNAQQTRDYLRTVVGATTISIGILANIPDI